MINFVQRGKNTKDATATSNDLLYGKTAYANNEKIIGNIVSSFKSDSTSTITSKSISVSSWDSNYMGTVLNNHDKYIVVQNHVINIYQIDIADNGVSLSLIKSINPTDIGLPAYIEIVRAGIFDTSKNIYNLVFIALNNGTYSLCTATYNPNNDTIIVKQTEISPDQYTYYRTIIPSPINANYFIVVGRGYRFNETKLYILDLSLNNTLSLIYTSGSYDNGRKGYNWANTNYVSIFFDKVQNTYKFDESAKSLTAINKYVKDDITYTVVLLSSDSSKAIALGSDNKQYYCDININDLTPTITNLVEIPDNYDICFFTNQNDVLVAKYNNSLYYLIYNTVNNTFSNQKINTTAQNFIDFNYFSTGITISADWKKNIYFNSSSSIFYDTIDLTGTPVLNTIQINNNILYNTTNSNVGGADVLKDKIAYGTNGKIIGTMANNGELNYTPSNQEQTIPAGYTSGGSIAGDSNLLAENIKNGVTIFGVTGTYTGETSNVVEGE